MNTCQNVPGKRPLGLLYKGLFSTALVSFAFAIALNGSTAFAADSSWQAALNAGQFKLKTNELVAAELLFKQAVKEVKKDKTASADDKAKCWDSLAAVQYAQDEFEDAVYGYRKELKLLEKAHGKDSDTTVHVHNALGDMFVTDGQYRQAQKHYQQSIAIIESHEGKKSIAYADGEHRLAIAMHRGGYDAIAEKLYFSSLTNLMNQQSLPNTVLLQNDVADLVDLLHKHEGRVLVSDFQTELLKDKVGDLRHHRAVNVPAWNSKVSAQIKNGTEQPGAPGQPSAGGFQTPEISVDRSMPDFASLEKINQQRIDFYERMVATDEQALGRDHPSVARDLTGLAYVYLTQKKYEDAKPLLNRVLQIYSNSYGTDRTLVKRTQMLLDLIARKQASDANGEAAVSDYAANLPRIPSEAQRLELAFQLNYMGSLFYGQGKIEQSEKVYSWALAATALSAGADSSYSAACMNDYAQVLRSAGRDADAKVMEADAYNILANKLSRQASLAMP